jgi:tetratricopeptide (TPR) repeat protein
MNINEAIKSALANYQAGKMQQAENICKDILRNQPNNANALHLLGIIYYQCTNYEAAITQLKKALEYNPDDADVYFNLGNAFVDSNQFENAITCYQNALRLGPNIFEAYMNLGNAFMAKGQIDSAVSVYRKAINLNPRLIDIYDSLAAALRIKEQFDEAISYYQKALQIDSRSWKIYCNLGDTFQEKGQFDEAISYYQKALQVDPHSSDIYNSLGIVFHNKRDYDKAITYYEKCLELNPTFSTATCNMGKALHKKGQLNEAITYFQKTLQLEPYLTDAHWNMSLALLTAGNYKQGWKEYEWRAKLKDYYQRRFPEPLWNGFDIKGRTILLHTEQGFGDNIMFIRYATLIERLGAKVVVECQKELKLLFRNADGITQSIARGEQLPDFDVHCPLLSMPLILGSTLETIPATTPYIRIDSVLLKRWRDKICHDSSKLKIGLAWASGIGDLSQAKSFPLDTLSPLGQHGGIAFYSLQKGRGAEEAKHPPADMHLIDYTAEIESFSDTAALIEQLDLVISVDTAVAHLAGALGKPIWTLLPTEPIWQWMLNREDTPWYPTMRLFRQPSPGDWESVIAKVKDELFKIID